MSDPLAYFLTFTTYGTWLHGREAGSVDRHHNQRGTPLLPANERQEAARRQQMRQEEYRLDEPRRAVVLRTIREVVTHRGWLLWAVHVRTNHVHIVVTAPVPPEKVMSDFKAWCSRRLREAFHEPADRDRWTQHGSTLYLWSEAAVVEKLHYVLEKQGMPMARYDGRTGSEPEASATALPSTVADASGSDSNRC